MIPNFKLSKEALIILMCIRVYKTPKPATSFIKDKYRIVSAVDELVRQFELNPENEAVIGELLDMI